MPSRTSSREKPRMSAQKMGEYLYASAHRRERILRDQKYPPLAQVVRYERARRAISAALLSTKETQSKLIGLAASLEQQIPKSGYDAESLRLSALAVRRFSSQYTSISFHGASAVMTGTPHFHLRVEGVTISVSPAVLLRRVNRLGNLDWGALLLVIRKGEALDERSGSAIGEMLRLALVQGGYEAAKPTLCLVVDVFSGRNYSAPSRSQRLGNEIASACREIADRWPSLPESNAA